MEYEKYFKEGLRYSLITSDEDNSIDIIASFIAWGVRNRKKCFYYVDMNNFAELEFFIKNNHGLELSELIGSGKLVIGSALEFYRENSLSVRLTNIKKIINNVLDEGYTGVALVVDRERVFESKFTEELIYKYEKVLNQLFKEFPIAALNCYNIDKFGVDAIFALSHLNPNFIYKRDGDVYVHNEIKPFLSPKETLGIVYNFLKAREKIKRENKIYEFVGKILGELSYKKSEKEIIETALTYICESSIASYGFAVLERNGKIDVSNIVEYNMPRELISKYEGYIKDGAYANHEIFLRAKCFVIDYQDMSEESKKAFMGYGTYSAIIIPLKYNDYFYGYVWLGTQNKYVSFKDVSESLYKICETIAKLIREYREFKKKEESFIQSSKIQALGELTGGIAHEFNNILTPILGYTQILKNKIDNPELLNYIEMIENSANDGAKIVRRIQEFSRSKKRKKELIDVDRAIVQSVEIAKPKWTSQSQIQKKFINVELDLKSGGFVEGAENEVREIFVNLISNAVDAMPHGGLIKIQSFNKDKSVIIRVRDTGTGMDEDTVQRIFEPFFTTKNDRGNGLGLHIVYNIIKQMKGTIEVESEVGEGSEFIIKLPLKAGRVEEASMVAKTVTTSMYKVLVIDDQIAVAQTVSKMLNSIGHEAVYVTNDSEALELFNREKFDFVLCDLAMQNLSGVQMAKIFKKINNNVPFILMTGWLGKLKSEDLRNVDRVIQKPFSIDEINEVLCNTAKKEA
jgi:signal transduction histidine kinase/CheY-like chemotaxis protein